MHRNAAKRSVWLRVGLIAGGLFGLSSQAGAVDGPGIGALTYQSSEVTGQAPIKVIYSTCKDYPSAGNSSPRNNSHVLMHRGWLISVMAIDSGKVGGGIEVYDFANPRNPVLKKTKCDSSTNPLRESHTYGVWRNDADGKEYLALTSTKGVQIWDVTNLPTTLTLVNDYSLPSVTANDYADGSWWLSWVGKYIYVGGSGNGMYTVDASNPASMKLYDPYNLCWHGVNGCVGAPLKPVDIGDFRTNVVQVVGNVMLVGGADTAPGMAMFDLTDPLKPVYRQKIGTPSQSYNYQLAGKWGDVNTLLAFKGTGSSSGLQIIQVSNDLRTLTSLYNNSALVNSKIGYLNYQDGYFHGGYSSNYRKIDVRNPTAPVVTKTGKSSQAGVDEDFATVLGNVVFAGNDHDGSKEGEHNGSAIYAHQTNPDTTPPAVTYITPNVGATGQKASVRVGVIFSDNVDLRYVNTTTFAVKNAGTGATLPGRYTAQFHYAELRAQHPLRGRHHLQRRHHRREGLGGQRHDHHLQLELHHHRHGLDAAGQLQHRYGLDQERRPDRHHHPHGLHRQPRPQLHHRLGRRQPERLLPLRHALGQHPRLQLAAALPGGGPRHEHLR